MPRRLDWDWRVPTIPGPVELDGSVECAHIGCSRCAGRVYSDCMAHAHLTISPEDVRRSGVAGTSGWLDRLADFVREAAASGETVEVTSRLRMMTPEQVADALGVSRSTVSRKIKAGEIRAVKVGNRNRIPYDEFERYVEAANRAMVALVADEIDAELFGDD